MKIPEKEILQLKAIHGHTITSKERTLEWSVQQNSLKHQVMPFLEWVLLANECVDHLEKPQSHWLAANFSVKQYNGMPHINRDI